MRKEDLILLNMAGGGKKTLEKLSSVELEKLIRKAGRENDLEKELALAAKHKADIITIDDKKYPKLLKEIYSPPVVLYVRGKILENSEFGVAVVGSRQASPYGIAAAEKLGYELASMGIVVVSGLARGVDSAAHKGALRAHGRTIAVLGNGLKSVYPPENKGLAEEIAENAGAVVSEFSMAAAPISGNFPRRNRVISGLSLAVIVVEAVRDSGALITADFAIEQNREVFAVPGRIDSSHSFGANRLIKEGAKLIQCAQDVVEELNLKLNASKPEGSAGPTPNLTEEEAAVYGNLSCDPRHLDDLIESAGLSLNRSAEILLKLQFKKLVKELPGKNYVRAQ